MALILKGTIKALNYAKIVNEGASAEAWIIDPFDLNGNLIPEMTVVTDTTLGEIEINLPSINILPNNVNFPITLSGNLNFKLTVQNNCDNSITYKTRVAVPTGVTIGGDSNLTIYGKGNIICTPLLEENWSAILTTKPNT
jgi:hypothetical protein